MDAKACLDREFLEMRCRLIDLAASLDRIDRHGRPGEAVGDARIGQIKEALAVLAGAGPGRAEQVQMVFSDPYAADWPKSIGLKS